MVQPSRVSPLVGTRVTPKEIYDTISMLGWPALFVVGQLRGLWFVKPHVDFILMKLEEVTEQLKAAVAHAERATDLAEQAHDIAQMAYEQGRASQALLEENNALLKRVLAKVDPAPVEG